MSTLRDLLNRTRWKDAGLHALSVRVVHRGAPRDERVIPGGRISAIRSGGIDLAPESETADSIFVPYHRFLAIEGPDGVVLWSKDARTIAAPELDVVEPAEAHAASEGTELVATFGVVLREASGDDPIVIDGSAGEGGGQILRSSLTLSMTTGTPFVLERIRAGRKKPGLMRQHLASVKIAALLCGATVSGAELGSERLVFRPGPVAAGDHVIDVGSAGAVGLVLQTIALPLALAAGASRITVRGGTHALWAPPYPFLEQAWLPLVRRAGAQLGVELVTAGFYPAGGGEVVMTASPAPMLMPLHLGETGVIGTLALRAIVANLSESIARRELSAAAEFLKDMPVELASESVAGAGPGNAMWLAARDEATGICNVFTGIGDVGVRAEDVGRRVAEAFRAWQASGTSVEPHLADQIMLPIALAGAGSFTTNELTLHARTNIEVIRAFTGRRLRAWQLDGARVRVRLEA